MANIRVDFFQGGNSLVTRLDPRTKLLYVAWIFIMIIVFSHPLYQALTFCTILAMIIAGRLSWRQVFRSGRLGIYVGLFSWLLWMIFLHNTGRPLAKIPLLPWPITDLGFTYGLGVAFRIFSLFFAFIVVAMTTSPRDLIAGLYYLRLPFAFSFVIGIILRLIPHFLAEHATIVEAQKSRACEFDKGGLWTRFKKHTAYVIPLCLRSLKIVSDMSVAMESRAFDPNRPRTLINRPAFQTIDYILLAVMAVWLITAVTLRLHGYGGVIPGLL
ncbi:Cobalt transport protein [Thermanaeromonas toyohensis ToBE]|uniref:Cobalt transport protein n=1 Tax=Thermanaeromonas toyohensis ToBE TaxID=698762 RepID=A0A1W1V8L0_9FIRM|nr:energy-coupling factor transporter transmembrane component T [Thermanaeromonas toyohensis]SMB89817.1 Cobalt transport protein [Thermanaeromonas toyohensis ToBE]